ncbi:MAG: MBOAT family protein [Myxococcales bacterium]|nr:MBOAT family protein [Myxococcales bacterium]
MLFNSLLFLVFLVVAVLGSWALGKQRTLRFAFLLVASYLFYMAWNPRFIALIVASTLVDFWVAQRIEDSESQRKRKSLLFGSLAMNLGLLGYFKYTNFFLQSVSDGVGLLGGDLPIPIFSIVLPVGISFYTFQTMSYSVDVYRRHIPAERSLLKFALYVSFFPQLVAGPIVRAADLLPQFNQKISLTHDDVGAALFRIARGLVKKIVIADFLAVNLVDRAFSNPSIYSSPELMVALYAYTMQIYCDFSGYTDVAIGTAQLLGYKLPENFDRPYSATTVAGFWRRWHITLAGWLRYYVFFPLGGSRGSIWKAHRNTFITLILIGLWHGANWTFVVYGAIHGLAISINRMLVRRNGRRADEFDQPWHQILWKVFVTFHFVVLLRILFRAPGFGEAADYTQHLFSNGWGLARIDAGVWALLALSYGIHWTPRRWVDQFSQRFTDLPVVLKGASMAALAVGVATVAETDVVPFIYFQF